MVWAKTFSLLVTLALWILQYLERQRTRTEAQLEIIRRLRDQADEFIRKAENARRNVDHSPGAILADPDNRDNDKRADQEGSV